MPPRFLRGRPGCFFKSGTRGGEGGRGEGRERCTMNTRDDAHDRRRHRPMTDWTSHRGFVPSRGRSGTRGLHRPDLRFTQGSCQLLSTVQQSVLIVAINQSPCYCVVTRKTVCAPHTPSSEVRVAACFCTFNRHDYQSYSPKYRGGLRSLRVRMHTYSTPHPPTRVHKRYVCV